MRLTSERRSTHEMRLARYGRGFFREFLWSAGEMDQNRQAGLRDFPEWKIRKKRRTPHKFREAQALPFREKGSFLSRFRDEENW